MDRVGLSLYKIADHALWAKDRVSSETVKRMWLEAVLNRSGELDRLNDNVIDLLGNSEYSVFQHLEYHSSLEIETECPCGMFYHKDHVLTVRNLEQVSMLGSPRRYFEAKMPFCLKCNKLRILHSILPLLDNWMLVFRCDFSTPTILSEIPQILHVGIDKYKLEYISYSQEANVAKNIRHAVSLQFIRLTWYVFDSSKSPKFFKWFLPTYQYRNAILTHIVYFKC
jgi:hypothetical protein